MKERYNFVADLYADCRFFFVTPTEFNEKIPKILERRYTCFNA